jgi:carboxyl-terminal processing protease
MRLIRKMKFKHLSILFAGTLFLNSACATDSTKVAFKTLQPEAQHPTVFTTAMQLIATYHYQKPQINDKFSSEALDNYIKHIDPSHVYFLESDLSEFEKFRYSIDESIISTGDLSPAYEIFNRYQTRLLDRINFAITYLNDSTHFNYTLNDSFMSDREEAPYAKTADEMNRLWEQKLRYECLAVKVTGKDYKSYSETIRKRYENLRKFASKTKSEDVFQAYCNSLAELADPHTNYFSPRASEDFNTSMRLSLEGIGATLQTDNEHTKVNQIVKGGPADKSKKLLAGDKIIGVAQGDSDIVNVIDWRLDDVVALIRGKKGTIVRLEIIPASEPNVTKIISLKRDKIVLEDQSAKSSIKEIKRDGKTYKYGVISLPAFYIDFEAARRGDPQYKSTTRDVKKLIGELKKQNVSGIIIDLRNNGGGSLQEAVELTGLFIKSGAVVQVKDAAGITRSEVDKDPEVFYEGPLTVLVNRFSASASEIFAAAMQDYGRAIVLGEKTFGKGTVQNVVDLNEFIRFDNKTVGQVKLTIAKFYRINGSSTQHKGVIPDIEFPSIYADAEFGEDASTHALPWDQIGAVKYEMVNSVNPDVINQLRTKHDVRMAKSDEYAYLQEDIKVFEDLKKDKYITLNEAKYKKENDEADAKKKKREAARKDKHVTNPDLILDETLEVMTDMR